MSTTELQCARLRISRRNLALASLFLLTTLVPLINGRATYFVLPALLVILLVDAVTRNRLAVVTPEFNFALASIGAFIVFAAASASWAMDPVHALLRVAAAAMIAFGSVAVAGLLHREQSGTLVPMAAGLLIGFAIGLLFCLAELLANHMLKLWVLETLHIPPRMWRRLRDSVAITESRDYYGVLNRSVVLITLLLWPALMIVAGLVSKRWRIAAAIVLTTIALTVISLSSHLTSKLAIVLGGGAFALAYKARRLTFYSFAAAWAISCLAIVPLARLPYQLGLHHAPWLKMSAQHRIIIWNSTAEQVGKAPVFGHGADMTPVLAPIVDQSLPPERWKPAFSTHPHNVFLQTWFELGGVGALLLTIAGLAILLRVRVLEPPQQPFAFAMLACAGASLHASFGMWGSSYMCLFGLAAVWFALGRRALAWGSDGQDDKIHQPAHIIVP